MTNLDLYRLRNGLLLMDYFRATKFNYFRSKVLEQLDQELKHVEQAYPLLNEVKKEYQNLFFEMAEKENGQPLMYTHRVHPLLLINYPKVEKGKEEAFVKLYNELETKHKEFMEGYGEFLNQPNETQFRTMREADLPTGQYVNGQGQSVSNELLPHELTILEPLIVE